MSADKVTLLEKKYGVISVVGNNSKSIARGGSLLNSEIKLIGNSFIARI